MTVAKQRGSGAQQNCVSKKKEEGNRGNYGGMTKGKEKKRGRIQAARCAGRFRNEGCKVNTKLSFSETIDIMTKRKKQFREVSSSEVREEAQEKEARGESKRNNESEKKYKASIDKKKVPIYGY